MVPIWSERLPCSSHSADPKIDHPGGALEVAPGESRRWEHGPHSGVERKPAAHGFDRRGSI